MAEKRRKREVAWRIFAKEFNSATVELPSEDQYSPTYLLSPLGALINRIFLTGVLTECENVGTDLEPLWRGRVSDPTDIFYISAGQFQPNAARSLAELEVPALVGIVGKARTYSPDESTTYVSVRVEQVKEITQDIRDYWVLEACKSLNYRLGCMGEALQMSPPESKKLISLGYSKSISNGVIEAINQYGPIELNDFGTIMVNTLKELTLDAKTDTTLLQPKPKLKQIAPEALESDLVSEINLDSGELVDGSGPELDKPDDEKEKTDTHTDTDVETDTDADTDIDKETDTDTATETDEALEKIVFEIINSLVDENPEGVIYEEVQVRASEQGLDRAQVEEHISSLIDKGLIYEPSIGLFKAV